MGQGSQDFRNSLQAGVRIHYSGDMANRERFGTIVKRYQNKWGDWVDIVCDRDSDEAEAYEMRAISVQMFSEVCLGHGGTRFVTEAAWEAFRAESLRQAQARYQEMREARS